MLALNLPAEGEKKKLFSSSSGEEMFPDMCGMRGF